MHDERTEHRTDPLVNYHRDVFAARTRDQLTRETHVVIGDHSPERRGDHARFAPSKRPRWRYCVGDPSQ